jgi:hypothetical protein
MPTCTMAYIKEKEKAGNEETLKEEQKGEV